MSLGQIPLTAYFAPIISRTTPLLTIYTLRHRVRIGAFRGKLRKISLLSDYNLRIFSKNIFHLPLFFGKPFIYWWFRGGRGFFIFHTSSTFFRTVMPSGMITMPTKSDCNAFYDSKIGQVTMMEMPSIPP